jgi:hypothetical protein
MSIVCDTFMPISTGAGDLPLKQVLMNLERIVEICLLSLPESHRSYPATLYFCYFSHFTIERV